MKRAPTVALVSLLVLTLAVFAALSWVRHYLHSPLHLERPVVFTVAPGTSLVTVTRQLARQGILQHPRILLLYARVHGQAQRIRAGEYEIRSDSAPVELLGQLVRGDVILREITIVEGWTVRDMLRALAGSPYLEHTLEGVPPAQIMVRLDEPATHPEGQFFPDTYRFARGTADIEILRKAHAAMRTRLESAWSSRDMNLTLAGPYQALILASLVEKESALPAERARIAGVFMRRLQLGMRLQSDPTVIYGLGERYTGDIRSRDLRDDTPYNTYTRAGLPPTPIALPGAGSLQAAAHPEDSGALFFVATGEPDGSHYFSATLAEHNAAVKRYLARARAREASP